MFRGEAYTDAIDIWSLGITTIELADKVPPLFGNPLLEVAYTVGQQKHNPGLRTPTRWSSAFQDLIQCMLQNNPVKRWSARELLDHTIFADHDRKALYYYITQ